MRETGEMRPVGGGREGGRMKGRKEGEGKREFYELT